MPANTSPIFSRVPVIAWADVSTANTAKDGTGTVAWVFTAGADGGRIDRIKIRAKGTNVATVLRVWINNGLTNATAANNTLFFELTIAATTVSEVAALADNEITMNLPLPPGYRIGVTLGTAVAAGLHVTGIGGSY